MEVAPALIPLMAFNPVAAGAVRFPIRLLEIVNVVPEVILIPFTIEPAWLPERSAILFLKMFVVAAPPMDIPLTVDVDPVLDKAVMVLLLILMTVEVLEHEIPITFPPVPVEDRLLMVLFATATEVALFADAPRVTPVSVP